MMKKLFYGGGNDKSSWVGKVLYVGRHQCLIEEIIAEGGYALVFLVKSSLGQRYALKRVSVNEIKNLEMCKQEIAILKMLSGHKNTIGYIDSVVNNLPAGIYEALILMEYCKAGHVVQLMNECLQTGFTEKLVMKIFCDVCEAVALLHGNKPPIIHRDLKVENVLRKQTGDFVLCDYGSAHFGIIDPQAHGVQSVEDEISSCTTVAYRAPEMVDLYSGQKITVKADIWALGCLLYKLCFFTTPFGESALAIQNGQFSFPDSSRFSNKVHTLIKMMLQVDQSKRADIFQVANFAFDIVGRPCPVRNTQPVRHVAANQSYQKPRAATPSKTANEDPEATDGRPQSESHQTTSIGSSTPQQQQQQVKMNQPVSTSLAPRQRPKGVAKFAAPNDSNKPKPFKKEPGEVHGQQQKLPTANQHQPYDVHDKRQYHKQQQQQQQQHRPQQHQQQFMQQQQQLQNQQRFAHQHQQQQQQQELARQQQQQELARQQQQQELARQQQQQEMARQQQQQEMARQQQQQEMARQQQQQEMARQQLMQQQQTLEHQKHLYDQQRQAYEQEQQRKAFELQQQQQAYEQFQRQQQQQQVYMLQVMEQQRMAEYQMLQRQHQLQQQAHELEQQRMQFLAEQKRLEKGFHIVSAEHEHGPFDSSDVKGNLDSESNVLISYQDNSNIAVPAITTNPFDDNFLAGSDEAEEENKLNPFDNAFTVKENERVTAVKDRVFTSKSHCRSRSDTFSDLARRSNDDGGAVSNQLLSVNETGSPHKSSPDIRMEQAHEHSVKVGGFGVNGHSTVTKIDIQGFSELYQNRDVNSENAPKLLMDLGKPLIGKKLNNNSGTNANARRDTKKEENFTKSDDSKSEKPTLEEADESPLISPSSSVQERRYVYVRTSSCSSEEASDKSKPELSDDETDFAEDRIDYDGIHSSSSSLEAELEDCDIKETEKPEANDDIFGSAPFHIETKKQSKSKTNAPSIHIQKRKDEASGNEVSRPELSVQTNVPPSHSDSSGKSENALSNPFGMDPFTVPVKSEPLQCKVATSVSRGLKAGENQLSRSPTSEDPFGHAPFIKIVKHRRPLSSQELAERKEGERKTHSKLHQRRRMLPRAPINE